MISSEKRGRDIRAGTFAGMFCLIAILRILANFGELSQAYDEPAHIVCGLEWLEKGTFTLEPVHPPLPRVLAALGPFLDGARLPQVRTLKGKAGEWFDIFSGGNDVLHGSGNYRRTLALARIAQIPLFCLVCALVFFWARRLLGKAGGAVAVGLLTLIPSILAFASLAYVDLALAVSLPAMLWIFTGWLDKPTLARGGAFGFAAALAILSNFTALLFGSACLVAAVACWWIWGRSRVKFGKELRVRAQGLGIAILVLAVTIWAGYRFSVRPLNQTFQANAVRQLPVPAAKLGLRFLQWNPPLPAPDFFKGLVSAFMQNQNQPPSYVLGQVRRGGFWYFYWLDLLMKTPLPFLVLAAVGIIAIVKRERDWRWRVLAVSILAVLLVSMTVKVSLGIRHILFLFPLLAIVAALGFLELWKLRTRWPRLGPAALGLLLGWLLASSIRSQTDPISYYNELAGAHPEQSFLFGCDFDCGQDVWRLSKTLHEQGVAHWSGRVWTSADLARMDLPPFEVLVPGQRATGWVVMSVLYQRTGNGIWTARDLDAYQWLDAYKPVAYVGRTIRLYNIPESTGAHPADSGSSARSSQPSGENKTQNQQNGSRQ